VPIITLVNKLAAKRDPFDLISRATAAAAAGSWCGKRFAAPRVGYSMVQIAICLITL